MIFDDFKSRIDAVEECYEFMLAYAAQGIPTHTTSDSGTRVHGLLGKAAEAIQGMPESYAKAIVESGLEPQDTYHAWGEALTRDAQSSLAAIGLVLAQPNIGSQIIDNLNASIHLRALLTDLFLIDEVLKGYEVVMPN